MILIWKYLGVYSDSVGVRVIREDVVKYIIERDGYFLNFDDIFLCIGVSDGIKVGYILC